MLAVVLTDKCTAKNCAKVQEIIFVQIINLFLTCMVLSCIIMHFSWANLFKKFKWHKAHTPPLYNQNKQDKRLSERSSFGFLFNVCAICNLHNTMSVQTNFLPCDPALFTKFMQLRHVQTGLENNTCQEHVQMCSMCIYVHAFYYVSFLSSLRVLLKINITAIKRNHNCPIIELLSNVHGKHPSEF